MLDLSDSARAYVLAFADDEHAIGSRHANWIGMGPFLEEDLAFCSIAQDELGHALALYELIVPATDVDHFALLRAPADYRSCSFAELECASWPDALVRHWLYDLAEGLRWEAVRASSVPELQELAVQVEREELFHRDHASMMISRVCADPASRERIQDSLDSLLADAVGLWAPPEREADAVAEGVADRSFEELAASWTQSVEADCAQWGLNLVWPEAAAPGRLTRSPGFDAFHASLGEVISLDPTAVW